MGLKDVPGCGKLFKLMEIAKHVCEHNRLNAEDQLNSILALIRREEMRTDIWEIDGMWSKLCQQQEKGNHSSGRRKTC